MRDADANEIPGELVSALGGTLIGVTQLRIPWSDPLIESAIFLPLVSVDPEYQDRWCALKSPRIRHGDVYVGNDQLRVPYFSFYGKFF